MNGFFNEWPDPQFCIQDQNEQATTFNDQLTGTLNPYAVSSNTIGSSTVVCNTAATEELQVGDLLAFQSGADPALRKARVE